MKNLPQLLLKSAPVMVALIMVLVLAVGCSNFESPVMSQNTEPELGLWTPQPGDQVVPGRDVPILSAPSGLNTDGVVVTEIPVSAVIGPAGGCLRLGHHSLNIPAGAVNRDVLFTMASASLTGVAVDCGPSPFSFRVPVELRLSYAGTQYETSDSQGSLEIFYMANGRTCIPMPSHVDQNGKSVTAQLDHFSRYIIG
jgi:hypothetical protein